MIPLHTHQGFNPSEHLWHQFGNITTLLVFTAAIICSLYSLHLWYSLRHIPIIDSHSNIHTIYQRLLIVIRNHIFKIVAGNVFSGLIVMAILLSFVERLQSGYMSMAYLFGSALVTFIAIISARVIASTAAKVVYESEKHTLNQREQRLNVAKKGSSLVASFAMSLVLISMFLLHLFYNRFAHSLVRRQVLHCILSFAFGGISTALVISSIGGILSKGFDIGSDTYGKLTRGLEEDSSRNAGSLYDAAGDVMGKGIGATCRRTAEFITVIAVAMIITHFETKSIDGTSIPPEFISIPYLIGAIALIVHVVISMIMNCSQSSYIGIKGIQLGAIILLIIFTILAFTTKRAFVASSYHTNISGFSKVMIALGAGLIVGTLIALQSHLFVSPRCRFFKQVYQSTTTGASTNLIQGLATGYLVTIIPTIIIAAVILKVYLQLNSFGIALIALGMGSTLPIVLNVVNVSTILDAALCLSKLTTLNNQSIFLRPDFQESRFQQYYVRMFSVTLNTLSAAALFLFFLYLAPAISDNYAVEFGGLLIGSMFPYIILSLNLRASASLASQFFSLLKVLRSSGAEDIYLLSIWEVMLFALSCLMVILMPLLILKALGVIVLKGFIAGCLLSGLQIAISSLSSGTVLAAVNERIEREHLTRSLRSEAQEEIMWKGGIVGDNVGDPLKDIGEPVINLMLSSIIMMSILVGVRYYQYPF